MHRALLAMLTETITQEVFAAQDAYGKPIYSAPVSLAARVEYKPRRVVDATGQERVSRATVFLDGTAVLGMRDRLTLPDGTSSPIMQLYGPRDVNGSIDHWEATL